MRFTIDAKTLESSLAVVRPAIATRSPMPVLQQVYLSAAEKLVLRGGDGEVSISYSVDADVAQAGNALLNPSKLADILRASDGDVRVESKGANVEIVTTSATYSMPTEDAGVYPGQDSPADDPTLTLEGPALASAIAKVAYAASKDEGKYAMRGVQWDAKGGKLVATDGKRLAVDELGGTADVPAALVPPKAMALVAKLCDGDVKVWLPKGNGLAYFASNGGSVSTRLVEGRFPPYADVVPKKKDVKYRVPIVAGAFLGALRQAALMADDESKRVAMAFSEGAVVMQAQGATTGHSKVVHKLPGCDADMVINFDPQYVKEALSCLDSDSAVTLELVDPAKSAVFRQGNWLCLIVPLC